MRIYNFHTIVDGRYHWVKVEGLSVSEALATLRAAIRDGETIVGW